MTDQHTGADERKPAPRIIRSIYYTPMCRQCNWIGDAAHFYQDARAEADEHMLAKHRRVAGQSSEEERGA